MSSEWLYGLIGFAAGWIAHSWFMRICFRFLGRQDPEFKKRLDSVRRHLWKME
jgi:hypothetical protein